jgi:hypothetical protein
LTTASNLFVQRDGSFRMSPRVYRSVFPVPRFRAAASNVLE